jgi:fibro-slime domain-containing protein
MRPSLLVALSLAAFASSACSSGSFEDTLERGADPSTPIRDDGEGAPTLGSGGHDDGVGRVRGTLYATIRDFRRYSPTDKKTNPDFENIPHTDQNGHPNTTYVGPWDDASIVRDTLGPDHKPVYKSSSKTLTTHGKAAFDQWYRDVPGINVNVVYPITLIQGADGASEFDSEKVGVPRSSIDPRKMFFPIDDGTPYATPFGNEGDSHNYAFTVELHTTFTYKGGEFFNFRGDDDVFVFIDEKLVINVGGIHGPESTMINVDALGLTKGQDYPLDFFSAERHKVGSTILFSTTLDLRPAVK